MRVSGNLSLFLAAATHVAAQSTTSSSSATPGTTNTPSGPQTGELGDALEVLNNPVGVVYKATFPESASFKPAYPDGGNIKGEIVAVAEPGGKGVRFTVKLSNLPQAKLDLPYHLHVAPVPEDGNCTKTLAHLDPFIRGEATPCDKTAPATCQVGDLSGKHGVIPAGSEYETSYVDLYASTLEGIGAFFGNRSVVIHYPNKTRITCANFVKVDGGANLPGPSSGSGSGSGSSTSTGTAGTHSNSTATPRPTTTGVVLGAASSLRAGIVGAVMFGAAVVFML